MKSTPPLTMCMCRHHEQKMEEAVAAWGVAKGAAEKRFVDGRDAAAGAWLAALQQAQASAAGQLLSAQQRWSEVIPPTQTVTASCRITLLAGKRCKTSHRFLHATIARKMVSYL